MNLPLVAAALVVLLVLVVVAIRASVRDRAPGLPGGSRAARERRGPAVGYNMADEPDNLFNPEADMRKLMGTRWTYPLLLIALVAAVTLGAAACAQNFQKVSQANEVEKAVVEDAFKQAFNLTRTTPPKVSPAQYETIKVAYNVWAGAQRVRADVGTEWLKQINEEKVTGKPAAADLKGKYEAAARTATAAYASFVALVTGLVNLKTSDAPDAIPLSSLPLALAGLPLVVGRRRLFFDPPEALVALGFVRPIMGGAGTDVDQILAAIKAVLGLISGFEGKASELAAQGLNALPYLAAIGHVASTAFEKIRAAVSGGGTDFLAMTPAEYHAFFSPKTIAELEAEARAENPTP